MSDQSLPRIIVMPKIPERVQRFGWGLFSLIVAVAALVALGIPLGPILAFAGFIAILFTYHYPYTVFAILVALVPFSGITLSVPLGATGFVERAFGGSIDVAFADVVAGVLLAVWALKVWLLWIRRGDVNWRPRFPLILPALGIFAVHLLSAFSPLGPDAMLVVKYALRPVFFSYVAFVLLSANFLRSPRRFRMALGTVAATGVFSALVGMASLAVPHAGFGAVPLPFLGMNPLGDNHNQLAEWLCFSAPATLALVFLAAEARMKRFLAFAAGLQALVALLAFTRTGWIVMAVEAACLLWFVWREEVKRYASVILIGLLFLLPLAAVMAKFSVSSTAASSTTTRVVLTEIAVNLWSQSPFLGVGAGTFVTHVAQTAIFAIEFGAPLDAHGFLQKLLAEAGLFGLIAAGAFGFALVRRIRHELAALRRHSVPWRVAAILAIAAFGAFIYQLFNTDYWSGRLWLPIGLLIAAIPALKGKSRFDEPPASERIV